MDYDDTNRGRLFKNDKKETEKHPDYRGEINVEGKTLELAAWLKVSQKGTKYMSLKVSEPREKAKAAPKKAPVEELSDDIPF